MIGKKAPEVGAVFVLYPASFLKLIPKSLLYGLKLFPFIYLSTTVIGNPLLGLTLITTLTAVDSLLPVSVLSLKN